MSFALVLDLDEQTGAARERTADERRLHGAHSTKSHDAARDPAVDAVLLAKPHLKELLARERLVYSLQSASDPSFPRTAIRKHSRARRQTRMCAHGTPRSAER